MADEKHESKRSCYSRHKWLSAAAATLLLVFLAAGFSFRYISFMSQTIYQESTSHLEEVLYKSNSMLKEMVRKNLTYLHLCNGFLKNTSNEDEIQAYIEEAQQATGFVNFYFLSYDGNYTTVTGETGYLGLQTNLDEKLSDGEDIVVNTALPGKAPMLAFICPETQGSYRGFAYDAVAITYYNDAVLRLLDSSAFQGNASNYVIYPDGRVVIDNSVNRKEIIYNFIAMLRDHSDLSEEQILALSDDFAQGRSGNLRVKLGDTSYYLVYEDTAVQSWTMVGLVPVSIVNANLDMLWFRTAQIVAGVAAGLALLIILLIVRRNHTTPATALASRVLPVPGGPTSSTPLGMRAPRARYLSGWRRNSTISRSSSFSSSAPATSRKETLLSWGTSWIRASPKCDIRSWAPPGPAPVIRAIRFISRMNPRITATQGSRICSQLVEWSA